MKPAVNDLSPAIRDAEASLANLDADLAKMPLHKMGTKWYVDRIEQREYLRGRLAFLRARQREWTMAN